MRNEPLAILLILPDKDWKFAFNGNDIGQNHFGHRFTPQHSKTHRRDSKAKKWGGKTETTTTRRNINANRNTADDGVFITHAPLGRVTCKRQKTTTENGRKTGETHVSTGENQRDVYDRTRSEGEAANCRSGETPMGQKTETVVHVNPTVKSDESLKTQKEILLLKYCATELATAVKESEINRKGGTSKMDLQ